MKKIIAIAALASTLSAGALASTTGTTGDVNSNEHSTTTSFDFAVKATTLPLTFVTERLTQDPLGAGTNTALAATTFLAKAPYTTYKVDTNFTGDNTAALDAAFSGDGTTAKTGHVYINGVVDGEAVKIMLLKKASLAAGSTHVTYTVTGYTA